MILQETYDLDGGVTIPRLGLGTWFIDDDVAARAVRDAVEIGYRHVDTAQAYGNERGVGEGVRTCGLPRDELFVTTKLAAEIKDYEGAKDAIRGSLDTLGLDHVDLMLIHSPQPWDDFRGGDYTEGNRAAWRALVEAREAGLVRAVGVSNFRERDLDALMDGTDVAPQVDQLLVHAGNTPAGLLDHCHDRGILVEAYSPVGHGQLLRNPELTTMAERYSVTVPQLCIRYTLQLDTVSLPKTGNPEHMRDNAQVDFEISEADMAVLRALDATDYGEDAKFPVYSGK